MKIRIIFLLVLLVALVFSTSSCATSATVSYLSHPGGESIWYQPPKGQKASPPIKGYQKKQKWQPKLSFLRKS